MTPEPGQTPMTRWLDSSTTGSTGGSSNSSSGDASGAGAQGRTGDSPRAGEGPPQEDDAWWPMLAAGLLAISGTALHPACPVPATGRNTGPNPLVRVGELRSCFACPWTSTYEQTRGKQEGYLGLKEALDNEDIPFPLHGTSSNSTAYRSSRVRLAQHHPCRQPLTLRRRSLITYIINGAYYDSGVTLTEDVDRQTRRTSTSRSATRAFLRTGWQVKIDNEVMLINDLIDGGADTLHHPTPWWSTAAQAGTSVCSHGSWTQSSRVPRSPSTSGRKESQTPYGLGSFEVDLTFPPEVEF